MKTRILIFLTSLLIAGTGISNAQVGVLRRALNKQIEKEIDTAINKNAQEKSGTKTTGRGLFGGKIDIKYDDEYLFTGRIYMVMETYDKKDVSKSDFLTYFNANTLNAGMEVKITNPEKGESALPTQFIFDNDNRCFLMLIEGEDSKTGIISTIPDDSTLTAQTENQKTKETKPATITRTGNTRMIAGYKCDEYKVVEPDEDGYSNVWMTKDVKIKADKKNWGKSGMPTYYNYPGFEDALMLAMEAYSKDNKPEMKMETKEINENFKHSISTAGYTFMKMNFGQAGKK